MTSRDEISCPACNARIAIEPMHAGQMLACPRCGRTFQAPPAVAQVAAPPIRPAVAASSQRPPGRHAGGIRTHHYIIFGVGTVVMIALVTLAQLLESRSENRARQRKPSEPAEQSAERLVNPEWSPENEMEDELSRRLIAALGASNRKVPRLSDIVVRDTDDDSRKVILVKWMINDNLTSGMVSSGAKLDVANILKEVSLSGIDFAEVNLYGSFRMSNDFGDSKEIDVIKCNFQRETVDKINWDGFDFRKVFAIADSKSIAKAFQD